MQRAVPKEGLALRDLQRLVNSLKSRDYHSALLVQVHICQFPRVQQGD